MKKHAKVLLASGAMLLSSALFADTIMPYSEVDRLNVGGNGLHGTFVKLKDQIFPIVDANSITGTGCSTDHSAFVSPATNDNYSEIFSILLAAKVANNKVSLVTSGCGGNNGAYPLIIEVFID